MKSRCMIRKYSAILALSVSAILFIPELAVAQGAVIGYADGQEWIANPLTPQYPSYITFPSTAQLQTLTHVIATSIGSYNDGKLWINELPNNWSGGKPSGNVWSSSNNKNSWLENLVIRAHAQGVKVGIDVDGEHFTQATSQSILPTFVANLVSFVNLHGLDGVDINWEEPAPASINDWQQCIDLLNALKTALPNKRISIALSLSPPTSSKYFNNQNNTNPNIPKGIWEAADAIHLKTYDEPPSSGWINHSDTQKSKDAIDAWAQWNSAYSYGYNNKKLFVGSAFYGYPKVNGVTQWASANNDTRVNYATYAPCTPNPNCTNYNPGDIIADVQSKFSHSLTQGYGGVFAWELGFDVPATNSNSLLKAIWDSRPYISGPASVCPGSSGVFTANNFPGTVTWTCSSNLSLTYNGNTANVTNNYSDGLFVFSQISPDVYKEPYLEDEDNNSRTLMPPILLLPCPAPTGWIKASVAGITFQKTITENVVCLDNIAVSTSLTDNGNTIYTYLLPASLPTPYTTSWTVSSWDGVWMRDCLGTSCSFEVDKNITGTRIIKAITNNACGNFVSYFTVGASKTPYLGYLHNPFDYISVYPNPSSDILNIEIDSEAIAQARAFEQADTNDPTFDLRLYDPQGNLLHQQKTKGGKVEFNISNLPNGIYYLHIYDGVSSKPEMRQIVVEH